MKYIEKSSLPVPVDNNQSTALTNESSEAATKLKKMAACHNTPDGRKWVNALTLSSIVKGNGTNLIATAKKAGEHTMLLFLTSQFEHIRGFMSAFSDDKNLTIQDCDALATIALTDFGRVLQPKDVIMFTKAFRSGYIRTPGGSTFKMPELYGKVTQREIADALHVYTKAKNQSVKEYKAELSEIAEHYENQITSLSDGDRAKVKKWAQDNHQKALIAKIRLYERYLAGELQKERKELDALPPPKPTEPKFAGTRLAEFLGVNRNYFKSKAQD